MRWVFYSLIILNLLYLGWHLTARMMPATAGAVVVGSGAPERLQLLSEVGERSQSENGDAPAVASPAPLCTVIGPWPSVESGQAAVRALAAHAPRLRELQVARDRLNWVYLPPAESREIALRTLAELQSQGVDSFVVNEGENANAISLGYFSSEDSARGLRIRMRNAGYPARVEETVRQVTEYWLEIRPDRLPEEARLSALLEESPDLELDKAACGAGSPVFPESPQ